MEHDPLDKFLGTSHKTKSDSRTQNLGERVKPECEQFEELFSSVSDLRTLPSVSRLRKLGGLEAGSANWR